MSKAHQQNNLDAQTTIPGQRNELQTETQILLSTMTY